MAIIDETVRAYLSALSVDIDKTLERFCGSTDMLFKFLLRFPADDSYANAVEALKNGDYEAFYTAVHTLKGVSGNLGLGNLFEKCVAVLESLKSNDRPQAVSLFEELKTSYALTLEGVENIRNYLG